MEPVQETKELLIGINELALVVAKQLKDGLQFGEDILAIFAKWQTDLAFQQKLMAAVNGVQAVSAEIKDISIEEGVELAAIQLSYIPKILAAIKKDA